MATGRSDYPNQVNNVLGFPFIFRGALDVRATDINEAMKLAAVAGAGRAGAGGRARLGARRPTALESLRFGREYLIPKPFDYRVLLWVAPAVAEAAMETGVARQPIADFDAYRRRLEALLSRRRASVMRGVIDQAQARPEADRLPRGRAPEDPARREDPGRGGDRQPILLARRGGRSRRAAELELPMDKVDDHRHRDARAARGVRRGALHELRQRAGHDRWTTRASASCSRNYFGPMMVDDGRRRRRDLRAHAVTTPTRSGRRCRSSARARACGGCRALYMLMLKDRTVLLRRHDREHRPDRGGRWPRSPC